MGVSVIINSKWGILALALISLMREKLKPLRHIKASEWNWLSKSKSASEVIWFVRGLEASITWGWEKWEWGKHQEDIMIPTMEDTFLMMMLITTH
jgi:hypothetical protein